MLFVSDDKTRFITTTTEGAPCFTRASHAHLAKVQGLDLNNMTNVTTDYHFMGKGYSVKSFLERHQAK